ncbi:hypothetical protein OBV_33440 [Oscillibacter valericigenes Sjm18-20]|nr:hypothetical protein OBV_33440 [Oscillibacter valericigenes Sjm18-20]
MRQILARKKYIISHVSFRFVAISMPKSHLSCIAQHSSIKKFCQGILCSALASHI